MILFCTRNRGHDLFYLDLAGALARPPVAPAVYALVSFETSEPCYYVGSSRRLTGRLSAHFSFARSVKLRGHSAGGRFLAPVLARRRRVLVIVLETCAGADTAALQRREQSWILTAIRDCGAAALPYQIAHTTAPEHGPHAPSTLAARRRWPSEWVSALAEFFREPRKARPLQPVARQKLNGGGTTASARRRDAERGAYAAPGKALRSPRAETRR